MVHAKKAHKIAINEKQIKYYKTAHRMWGTKYVKDASNVHIYKLYYK